MCTTTHPDTEALEVAEMVAGEIRGKAVLVTGVNRGGIGFSTSYGFASQLLSILILTGRELAKSQESINTLMVEFPGVGYRGLRILRDKQKHSP